MTRSSRYALIAGLAAVLAACTAAPPPKLAVAPPPASTMPYLWTTGLAPQAHKDMVATFHRTGLAPGEYLWATAVPADGEARVIVDRLAQTVYAYRGEALVGAASISSAKPGRITPLGNWTVLAKEKMHRSRKYDDAPMPFMQRFDDYGTALHGGKNPGYPASHGCVRMPMPFAEKLFGLTRIGTKVIVEG